MTRGEQIVQEALQHSEEDRERIADSLWRSVHGGSAESIAEEWKIEIKRRIAEIDEGKVEMQSWDETLERLEKRFVR